MKKFRTFLDNQGLALDTIRGHAYVAIDFNNWCDQQGYQPSKVNTNQVYEFLDHCKEKGNSIHTIRLKRVALKYYFQFLKRKTNPAYGVEIKGQTKTLPSNLLDEETLQNLYRNYVAPTLTQKRNKVLLGMVIFQGLKREELSKLETEEIKLEEGKVYVAGSRTTNERIIPLDPIQIPALMRYLYEERPILKKEWNQDTSRLFFSSGTAEGLDGVITRLLSDLKRKVKYVSSLQQLRSSRASIWTNSIGLRKAQYFTGHRYVTSTERYHKKKTDDLREKLSYFHPLEKLTL